MNMFKVNNKDTRRMSDLNLFLISDFEKVNAGAVLTRVIIKLLYREKNYNTGQMKFNIIIKSSLKQTIYIVNK